MEPAKTAFDRVRNSEYTGENRCLPCTVLNVFLALFLAVSIALARPFVGAFVLGTCLLVIALRGYLVPGTPTLTARYLPGAVLRWFGETKPPERFDADVDAVSADPARNGERDAERLLLSVGVVEPSPEGDDLRLADRFRDDWWCRVRRLRDGGALERLAAVLDVDSRSLSLGSADENGWVTLSFEERAIAHWDSEAAFYADVATESTLGEWVSEWDELDDERRTTLIAGLRAFLETCPLCETPLEPVENVRTSCCSGDYVRVTVDCEGCSSRVFSGTYR